MIKKRELLEEISRIQEMMEVQKVQLDEQAAFSRFLSKVLPALGQTFEHNFFTELRTILKKDLTTVTPKEMAMAFKLPQMAGFRKQVADQLMKTEFETVDNILRKYNLSVPQESINAGKELASVLEIDPAFLKDVKASWAAKKAAGGASDVAGAAGAAAQNIVTVTPQVIANTINPQQLRAIILDVAKPYNKFINKSILDKLLFSDGTTIKRIMGEVAAEMQGKTPAEVADLASQRFNSLVANIEKTNTVLGTELKNQETIARREYYKHSNRGTSKVWTLSGVVSLVKYCLIGYIGWRLYKYFSTSNAEQPGIADGLSKLLPSIGGQNGQQTPGQNQGQDNKPSRGAIDKFR